MNKGHLFDHLADFTPVYTLKHVSFMKNLTRASICVFQVQGQFLICGKLIMLSHLQAYGLIYGYSCVYNSECQCSTYMMVTVLNTNLFFTHIYSFKIFINIFAPLIHPSVLLQQKMILLNLCRHKGFEEEETKDINFLV